jgi:hypothetical protein
MIGIVSLGHEKFYSVKMFGHHLRPLYLRWGVLSSPHNPELEERPLTAVRERPSISRCHILHP